MSDLSDEELKVIYEKTKGIMHITQHKRFWDYFNLLKEKSSLVDKQQKDIEDLKKVLNVEKVMCENMVGDVEIVCMYKENFMNNYGDDYISKDKIIEKIKELEQCQKEELQNDDEFGTHSMKWAIADYVIETLKELLGVNNE